MYNIERPWDLQNTAWTSVPPHDWLIVLADSCTRIIIVISSLILWLVTCIGQSIEMNFSLLNSYGIETIHLLNTSAISFVF